jgi:hypothetical protein
MSSPTQDNTNFGYAMSSASGMQVDKPYLKKELLYVIDNNGSSDYSRNQVQFETVAISNNGKWADYRNAFVSIPLVAVLTRSADGVADGSQLLNFKAGNHTLIDSMIIDYGNDNVIQQSANINSYCTFKQHTEFSLNDVAINGHTGYRKDSRDWTYTAAHGLENNVGLESPFKHHSAGQELVMDNATVQASGENYYTRISDLVHVYRYDCIIRLKDLLFFDKMSPVRGGNIKITLNLNQGSSVSTFGAPAAGVSPRTGVVNTLKGSSNFLLRTATAPMNLAGTETISLAVVQNGTHGHVKRQCRLYIPVHTMSPTFEKHYLSLGQKTVLYEDVYVQNVKKQSNNFQVLLTNSLSRMKRLVIVPMLSADANHPAPQESLYSCEPSTCSPCFIKDFNVQLSGSNVYQQNIQYKYEHFLNELNGSYGVNGNLETGLSSSMLDLKDYQSNFGYMVVDLSRRYSYDEGTPMSVQIQGVIESAKELDLLCFITYSKSISIDLNTGARIS